MTVQILTGDCREVLRTLADESVQCVVTSPPYWNLRDYGNGNAGIGLELTIGEHIEALVDVFREVRRVLRKDGTLWLNYGDAYASAGGPGWQGKNGQRADRRFTLVRDTVAMRDLARRPPASLKPKDLMGLPWRLAFALQEPQYQGRIRDERMRFWMAGLIDGEGCLTILETTSPHGSGNSFPPVLQVRMCDAAPLRRCAEITGLGNASPPQEPPSQTGQRASYQWRLSGRNAADIAAELYPLLLVKKRQALVIWNQQLVRESYVAKKGNPIPQQALEKQKLLREIAQSLNANKGVDLPSWLEEPPPIYSQGWWLRSDVVWAKPNPMPESITDRPTRAHEYLFLLAKAERYHYDAAAISEPATKAGVILHSYGTGAKDRQDISDVNDRRSRIGLANWNKPCPEKRNIRSVWVIGTEPFPEAHFATFPTELARRCILAGCPEGGTVLDPFGGAGTVGLVADRLKRNAILIELNPDYCDMARRRIAGDAPLFAEVTG